jgi:hypothetical protein
MHLHKPKVLARRIHIVAHECGKNVPVVSGGNALGTAVSTHDIIKG